MTRRLTNSPRLRFDFADARALGLPTPLCFEHPERVIACDDVRDVRDAMRAVEAGVREGFYAAGFVAYEAASAFDEALTTQSPRPGLPLVWFVPCREPARDASIADAAAAAGSNAPLAWEWTWEPDVTQDSYRHGIESIKAAIACGDTYQVNYTFRLRTSLPAHVTNHQLHALYQRLARTQRAPYAASLDLGRWRILSVSPELFFRLHNGRITTRPMKGTIARGRWTEEDAARAAWLVSSDKNRAENVMIVDLARNDVGRIAEIGSVRATSLFDVERYPTVFQMVSTVEGTLRERTTLSDVFAALFPAGSITGAPKSSSMRVIASVERAPRGVYCGAIGFVTPKGDAVFNVAIRTAVIDVETGRAEYDVGGGITWDSTTTGEYEEALSKAAVWSSPPPFELLETMRLERGVYARRARHVRRICDSATYLASCGFFEPPVASVSPRAPTAAEASNALAGTAREDTIDAAPDTRSIEVALDAHAREHPVETRRVRLLLASSGKIRVESSPFESSIGAGPSDPATSAAHGTREDERVVEPRAHRPCASDAHALPLPVVVARTPVVRDDRFLHHKTTHRAVYDAHRAALGGDVFDVLLWNEAREITEFTTGNVVVELDGARWTPPRECGLLAGVLRGELLEAGAIRERVVTIDDLARATRVWFVNSLRGWIAVEVRRDVASATRAG